MKIKISTAFANRSLFKFLFSFSLQSRSQVQRIERIVWSNCIVTGLKFSICLLSGFPSWWKGIYIVQLLLDNGKFITSLFLDFFWLSKYISNQYENVSSLHEVERTDTVHSTAFNIINNFRIRRISTAVCYHFQLYLTELDKRLFR